MVTAPSHLQAVCRLRLHVAALGARLSPPWWRTEFLSPTGLRYVQRLFPRTYLAAALESVTVAARRDHDAHVGRRSFHLFRLPAHMERQLGDLIRTEGTFAHCPIPETPAQLIAALAALAVPETPLTGTGPRLLGPSHDLSQPPTLHKLAALYAYAAQQGERIYPYFEVAEHA